MSQIEQQQQPVATTVTTEKEECPLLLYGVAADSNDAAPYTEPVGWCFDVFCERDLTEPFDVVFSLMALEAGKKDVVIDEFEIDALPEGRTEFELEHDMPDLKHIPVEDIVASHGIAIQLRYKGEFVAFRGAEIVVSFADPKMETEMPDEILPSMLLRKNLGVRGAPKKRNINTTTATTTAAAPSCGAGEIRPRGDAPANGANVPTPPCPASSASA